MHQRLVYIWKKKQQIMNSENRVKRDEAVIGTQQTLEALTTQGHNVLDRGTISEFTKLSDDVSVMLKKVPKGTKRAIVVYLD